MSDKKLQDAEFGPQMNLELSDKEIFAIGRIIAYWGALEHKIFRQTLDSLHTSHQGRLPREMNNLQPSKVLELWKKHVVDNSTGERKEVLERQHAKISELADYRHAIVHGMWDWSRDQPEQISVQRVRKDQLEVVDFTADDLVNFASELGCINFAIRYPGGLKDLAKALTEQGGYLSRKFVAMVTGSPPPSDWLSSLEPHSTDDPSKKKRDGATKFP